MLKNLRFRMTANKTLLGETVAPENDRFAVHRKLIGNGGMRLTLVVSQDDSTAQCDLLRCPVSCDPLPELLLFGGR
jgi:hypothetical protein